MQKRKNRTLTRTVLPFLARPEGFEPPAFGIGIHCDIQLRHGRVSCPFFQGSVILHHFFRFCKSFDGVGAKFHIFGRDDYGIPPAKLLYYG